MGVGREGRGDQWRRVVPIVFVYFHGLCRAPLVRDLHGSRVR